MTLTFDLFDLESGLRVTCDVVYLCANFSLPRPLCSRLRPDVRDRQTSDSVMPRLLGTGALNAAPSSACRKLERMVRVRANTRLMDKITDVDYDYTKKRTSTG